MNRDVILVDDSDAIIGYDPKLRAHHDGKKHRAVSIFILDDDGERVLLQKRSKLLTLHLFRTKHRLTARTSPQTSRNMSNSSSVLPLFL